MKPQRYTTDEDGLIVSMRSSGASYQEIGQAVGRRAATVHARAMKLNLPRGEYHRSVSARQPGPGHCPRCGILLAATPAPTAPNGNCAWCIEELGAQ